MSALHAYPVRIEGELDPHLSRWLWLVKWILAIPHYVALTLLWLTALVMTLVAFFAILATGRYPRGIFDFNLGVFRWTWRVAFYSYAALGTDRYPPFTLRDVPEYPARLEIEYPERLSRGLVLVKSWLLAIPHLVVVGILVGGSYLASRADGALGVIFFGGLIGVLVIFAGVAMLFTTRYPRGSFDLVLGLDRWVARVAAYVFLMRDEYPPFRLDQGALEIASAPDAHRPVTIAPDSHSTSRGDGSTAGRVELVLAGVVAGLVAFAFLVGGGALVAVDRTQRDTDGYVMSPSANFSTPTYALVSERAQLHTDGAERAVDAFLGDVRVRGESDRAIFVGIGPAAAVDSYLAAVEHESVTGFEGSDVTYSIRAGAAPSGAPGDQTFWEVSTAGSGEQLLDWKLRDGDWRIVVMNDDAARGVSAAMSIGAQLDSVLWIGIGLLLAGGLLATGAAFAIGVGVRGKD
jgi:Domain of unknown function (DUF4389)